MKKSKKEQLFIYLLYILTIIIFMIFKREKCLMILVGKAVIIYAFKRNIELSLLLGTIITLFFFGCFLKIKKNIYEGKDAETIKKEREEKRNKLRKGKKKGKSDVKQIELKEKEEELKADTKPPEQTEWDKIKMENPELNDIVDNKNEDETNEDETNENETTEETQPGEITGETMRNMKNLEGMRSLF